MVVTGKRDKAGVTYCHIGCNTRSSRGDAICKNSTSVSERKVTGVVINAIERFVQHPHPEQLQAFAKKFSEKVNQRQKTKGPSCVFRTMANTHSGRSRTAIPAHAEHPFRAKPNTDSGHAEHPGSDEELSRSS